MVLAVAYSYSGYTSPSYGYRHKRARGYHFGVPGYARVMMGIGPVVGAMRERGATREQRAEIAARIAEELEGMEGRVPAVLHLVTARA